MLAAEGQGVAVEDCAQDGGSIVHKVVLISLRIVCQALTGAAGVTIIRVMAKKQPFALIYDPDAIGHLDAIELKYHSLIRRTVEEQLAFEPDIETRNRKPLERPLILGARWEIRFGPDNRFRIFYRVDSESRQVRILGIGVKERNRIFLGDQEVKL